jgi:serine/threonine protein kinase
MSTARGEDKAGGTSPGGVRAPTGPSASPAEGRLLTSEDLFGDLVDDVVPAPLSPGATRAQPIKVQVSEPGAATKPSLPPPTAAEQKLPEDVAALLDAFAEGVDAAASEASPAPAATAAPGPVPVATAPDPVPVEPAPAKPASTKLLSESQVEPLLQILEELENEPEEEAIPAAESTEPSAIHEVPDDLRGLEGLRPPPYEKPRLEVTPVDEDPDGSMRAGLEDLIRLKLPVLSRRAAYEGGGQLPETTQAPIKSTSSRFEAKTAKAGQGHGIDLAALAQEALGDGAPFSGKRTDSRRSPNAFGPYRLLERIALGGMAEVFKAKRTGVEGFEKILAVKRILPHLSDNQEFVDMFIAEAKMVASLAHPNIVQIFDLGKIEKSYFIAMEYVHGRDLRTILRRARDRGLRLPLDLSVLIVSKVCSALEFAHRKKDERGRPMMIVHRDVSPQNILLSFEGDVKLTDFGIAKAASKATVTDAGALRGKLLYMSPEQAWGKPMDRRSDLFSLALVFYEMITEERPFMSTSEMSILEMVRECRIPPPSSLNPRVPERLEKLLMKALARDPEDRYQDAAELYRDLERVLHERRPAADALPRLMEVLFDEVERGDLASKDLPHAEDAPREAAGSPLEVDDAPSSAGEQEPAPAEASPSGRGSAKDPLSKLLKRFGIK